MKLLAVQFALKEEVPFSLSLRKMTPRSTLPGGPVQEKSAFRKERLIIAEYIMYKTPIKRK